MTDVMLEGGSWIKELMDLYSAGASDAEVAASQKITIKAYYKHMADNAKFAALVEYGRTLSQAFWESQARYNIKNKQFNTPLWTFYMKNKFGWADKTESVTQNENLNTDLDSLRQTVMKDVAKLMKDYSPEATDAQRLFAGLGNPQEEKNE